MVIHDADRAVARNLFKVAVGIVAHRDPDIPVREAAVDALRMPNASTCRALLAAGRGKEWLPSVIDAIAQVGIAAAEDVLREQHDLDEMLNAADAIDDRIEEHERPFGMQEFLGLSDRGYQMMRTKWAMIGDISLMLEDADIDIAALAEAAGENPEMVERWLRGMVRDASLDTLATLYDAAAEIAGWPSLEWIIRGNVEGDDE